MLALLKLLIGVLLAVLKPHTSLVAENLALRQQLAVLGRRTPRHRLRPIDRAFWVILSRTWSRWVDVLAIVKPATVVGWHRRGFARFWAWKSRPIGRPPLAGEIVVHAQAGEPTSAATIDDVERVLAGAPRGHDRHRLLTVPTVTFNVLYVFFVLSLERRRILHVNVTSHPHAAWTAQQIVEAVDLDASVVRLLRDRDGIYGRVFDARVNNLGIRQLKIAPRSPWQNGYAERFVGTLRRELLDHVIVLGERHLLGLVRQHARYYNEDRPHMSLNRDAPATRAVEPPGRSGVEPPGRSKVVGLPRVGGLHHRYVRRAA